MSKNVCRSRHIRFRVSDDEAVTLSEAASSQYTSRSAVLRGLIHSLDASTRIATKVETPVS